MADAEIPFWSLEPQALRTTLAAPEQGLTTTEADQRLERYGPNRVGQDDITAVWRLLARQFASPLVLILTFGAFVSLVLKEWIDATIILSIVFGSALLGFFQEYRASTALASLRQRLALSVSTRRNGEWVIVPLERIVPGDTIRLAAGNLVPADSLILEARDFLVSEAALTGESFPVEKHVGVVEADAALARRTNCAFLGTSVRSGTATLLVVDTGPRTNYGRIAGRMADPDADTEFARGLRDFGYMLSKVMVAVALFVLAANMLMHRPPVDTLLFALALAVGLSPELLPAIVAVTLSAGARRLAANGVIVRRLDAIENLGSIDVLCTDKTGTLTKGDAELSSATDTEGAASGKVLRLAYLNASLETGIANPLDKALVEAGEKANLTSADVHKLDEIPYDFLRKRLTIVVAENSGRATMITKGAVPNVIDCCTTIERGGARLPLDDAERKTISAYCAARAGEGFRILALATRDVPAEAAYTRDHETEMTLAGFLLFSDPLKEGIAKTVADLNGLGVSIKIVSGDNRYTAGHIGAAIGLDASRILTGDDIANMKDEALWHLAETTDIFAEVDPQQKEHIIRALQKRGHAVGYMGDGINDAPALLAADVGISVDQAVDVARESADVVLLRPDLDVLRTGILDGRRTFENTLKYIKITVSANFGNMISMAIATLALPFLPLLAKQILLNNFLSDFPSLAISTDNVDDEALRTAQRWSIADVRSFMIVFGLISSVFDLVTFFALHYVFDVGEVLFQSAWFVVSLLTELVVVLILRTRMPAWKSRPSATLLYSTCAVAVLAVCLPYSGGIARVFGLAPLSFPLLLSLILIVAAYALTTEFAKHRAFKSLTKAA